MFAQLCNAHLGRKKRTIRPCQPDEDLRWQQAERVGLPLTPPPLPPRTNNNHGNRYSNLRTPRNPDEPDDADRFLRYNENPAYGLIAAPGQPIRWDEPCLAAPPSPKNILPESPAQANVAQKTVELAAPTSSHPEKEKTREKSVTYEKRKHCCSKCALKRAKRISERRDDCRGAECGRQRVSSERDTALKTKSRGGCRFGYNVNDVTRFLGNSTLYAPANLPVVIDDGCWLHQGSQPVERRAWVPMGMVVNALFCYKERVFVRTPCGGEGFVPVSCCIPLGILTATKAEEMPQEEGDRDVAWMAAKIKTLGLEDCGKKLDVNCAKVGAGAAIVANKTDNQKLCEFNPACRKKPRCLPYCHCRLPSWKDGLFAV